MNHCLVLNGCEIIYLFVNSITTMAKKDIHPEMKEVTVQDIIKCIDNYRFNTF